jgi:hypothetical protein
VSQTYTSQWFSVSNGDITTHNPQSLVPTSKDIRILSAEIQWEGITTSEQTTNYSTNTDSGNRIIDSDDDTFSEAFNLPFPSVPSGYSFFNHAISAEVNISDGSADNIEYTYSIDGNNVVDSQNDDINGPNYTTRVNQVGSNVDVIISSESVDSNASSITLDASASTQGSSTSTTYYDTQDPRVTRDVSGDSGSLTLNDGETSNWHSLSGLAPNSEEFYHDISGSGEARFRFRFDWEQAYPDPVNGTVGFYNASAGVWRECAVADPTDSLLEYNHVAVYNDETGSWGALDVVDPSDDAAIESHQFYDPDIGWLAPREYSTTSS